MNISMYSRLFVLRNLPTCLLSQSVGPEKEASGPLEEHIIRTSSTSFLYSTVNVSRGIVLEMPGWSYRPMNVGGWVGGRVISGFVVLFYVRKSVFFLPRRSLARGARLILPVHDCGWMGGWMNHLWLCCIIL